MRLRTITFDSSSENEDIPVDNVEEVRIPQHLVRAPQNVHSICTQSYPKQQFIRKIPEKKPVAKSAPSESGISRPMPTYTRYILEHEKKMSWRGSRRHFMLTQGSAPLFKTKVKTGFGHSSEPINIMNGSEMHFSSELFIASIMVDDMYQNFSLRQNSAHGTEILTISITPVLNQPRLITMHMFQTRKQYNSKKPIRNPLRHWCLDFQGRCPVRSKKNAILINDDKQDVVYVMKQNSQSIILEASDELPALGVFTLGIAVCLVKSKS